MCFFSNGSYIDQLSILILMTTKYHLDRIEEQQLDISFLSSLFKFTFSQDDLDNFLHSLEVWALFLDWMMTKNDRLEHLKPKYEEALCSLLAGILKKIQFSSNWRPAHYFRR